MRVLVVCDVLGEENNGTTIAAMNLIRYLKRIGDYVRVLCADPTKKGLPDYVVVPERNLGFLVNYLVHKNNVTLASPNTGMILEALKDIDIVHVMMPLGLGKKTVKIARSMGIPVTSGFHVQAENYSSHLFNLMNSKSFNNHVYRRYYKETYKRVNAIHYPTEFIKDLFENVIHNKTNGYVISNGVNEIFKPMKVTRAPELADKFNILFIGRLSKEKSHKILVKAVALSKYKDNIQLIFAGQGPRLKNILKLEKKLKINPAIIKFYTREELVNVINSCDLYVHPSEVEIEAISCLEAIKCGLVPVISDSKKSATNRFALDEKSLFKNNDSKDLANKIDYWIEHPEEKAEYAQKYLQNSVNYDHEECMKQMREMLFTYSQKESHTTKTTFYYRDELNDDFALNGINTKQIPAKFKYVHKNPIYKFFEFLFYYGIAKPVVWFINKVILRQKLANHLTVSKKELKGCFIYANHTQPIADAYTPNIIFGNKNYIIVNPDAFSIPGVRTMVAMLGGLPLPSTFEGTLKFTNAIKTFSNKGSHVTIYPEAHIWPFYTKIRPFEATSFRYPVDCEKPSICLTNTYVKKGKKYRFVTHIDGPFYPDTSLTKNEAKQKLRDQIYECMCKRAAEYEQFEKYQYIKIEK